MSDAGRRIQMQGSSFEGLTKMLSALGATIKDGFEEMKAMRGDVAQQCTSTEGTELYATNTTTNSATDAVDKGFRTGRSVRGANPALTPVDYAVLSLRAIARIRSMVGGELVSRTAWATCNKDVYLDADTFFDLILDKTMEHRKDDAKEAEQWLMSSFVKPNSRLMSKKGKDRLDRVKPFVPLGQILPHHIEALKKRGTAAYFKSIKVALKSLSFDVAERWHRNNAYTDSDSGRKAIRAAMLANYAHLGAGSRLEEARGVGADAILHCTTGFYAMMSSFVRQVLEDVLYTHVRKPSHVDLTCYASWRTELFRVDSFLPSDKLAFNGMQFADVDDALRVFPNDDDKDDCYREVYVEQMKTAEGRAFIDAGAATGAAAAASSTAATNAELPGSDTAAASAGRPIDAGAAANAVGAASAVAAADAAAINARYGNLAYGQR